MEISMAKHITGDTLAKQVISMDMLEYSQFSHKLSITRKTRHKTHPVHKAMVVVGGGEYVHINAEQAQLIDGANAEKSVIHIAKSVDFAKHQNSKVPKYQTKEKPKFQTKTLDAMTCTLEQIEKAVSPTGTRTIIRDRWNRNKYWEVTHNHAPCYHYVVRQVMEFRNVAKNEVQRTETKKNRYRKKDLLSIFEIN